MDYNSIVYPADEDSLSRASLPHLDLQRIIRLSAIYAPSLTLPVFIGHMVVGSAFIFTNFLVSLAPKYSKGAFQKVAAAASANVEIPDSVLDVDDAILLSTGLIIATIQHKQAINKPFRLNPERCERLFSSDPNYAVLMELATVGAIIDTDPDFSP